MKKFSFYIFLGASLILNISTQCLAQASFPKALETCEEYLVEGTGKARNEIYNVEISLKPKGKVCLYKEKIYQGRDIKLLSCEFDKKDLPFLSESMRKFNETFKNEISKNPIFEAKMTSNSEIFQKYLVNHLYCNLSRASK